MVILPSKESQLSVRELQGKKRPKKTRIENRCEFVFYSIDQNDHEYFYSIKEGLEFNPKSTSNPQCGNLWII